MSTYSFFRRKFSLAKAVKKKTCEHPQCVANGDYRAPKKGVQSNIKDADTWHWFCLAHVREYNAAWSYYQGMSEKEIIDLWKRDITWDRPSWPLGYWHVNDLLHPFTKKSAHGNQRAHDQDDPFGIFDNPSVSTGHIEKVTAEEAQALKQLNLTIGYTKEILQKNYRELVKKYHPDVNGGSQEAENQIKIINVAHQILLNRLSK